ncbi:hypothetical protein CCUS01_14130 [Colletotrichum cuscutae]|uniref:Uncharacterized protein n=1 Tax=Colletotrichum cuscutae TaxID=1209917 RepID=A0AAI9YA39_9PEZI|nr:hypothetical protein CCUS01_14130 [Colletotrichum cuscutae]
MSIENNKEPLLIKLAADLTPSLYQYAESREAQSLQPIRRAWRLAALDEEHGKPPGHDAAGIHTILAVNGDGSRTCYQQAMRLVKEGEDFLMESYFEIEDF